MNQYFKAGIYLGQGKLILVLQIKTEKELKNTSVVTEIIISKKIYIESRLKTSNPV